MLKLAIVFLGAGFGGTARYLLHGWVQGWMRGSIHEGARASFPLGTLAVNVVGCLLLGLLVPLVLDAGATDDRYRLGLVVGVLGGFTTFSAFGYETVNLIGQRQFALAGGNIALSVALGLAAVWAGMLIAGRIWL